MNFSIERLTDKSLRLQETVTRDRVTDYLQAGNRAEDFFGTLSTHELTDLTQIRRLLLDPQFGSRVGEGDLTFAMLRPRLDLGKRPGVDQEIAGEILGRIEERFVVVLDLPWPVSLRGFTRFYRHVVNDLSKVEQITPDGTTTTVWEWFSRLGTMGATNFLILNSQDRQPNEQTWRHWREFIGATRPENALPETLRGDYGNVYNNIVHGSDSLASVRTDIQWMTRQLRAGS